MMQDDYYAWLLDKVDALHGEYENYSLLMQFLYANDFKYVLSMDANRAKGGLALRSIYAMQEGVYLEDVKDGPCSILEMLIGLADNMYMYTNEPTSRWFWEMIANLGLMICDDNNCDEDFISQKLSVWMDRKFDKSGQGSIFPLNEEFTGDSTHMEIWNQMNKYLLIHCPVGDWIG